MNLTSEIIRVAKQIVEKTEHYTSLTSSPLTIASSYSFNADSKELTIVPTQNVIIEGPLFIEVSKIDVNPTSLNIMGHLFWEVVSPFCKLTRDTPYTLKVRGDVVLLEDSYDLIARTLLYKKNGSVLRTSDWPDFWTADQLVECHARNHYRTAII